jgi:precorrin-6B methylase 2
LRRFLKALNRFEVFQSSEAIEINKARLEHLASLDLDLSEKTVLEVGAGLGLLTNFFEERKCKIVSTEGRIENIRETMKRFPHRRVEQLDLDQSSDITKLGRFEVIFCYGTLYHLQKPEQAIQKLATVCDGIILLETCVALGRHSEIHFLIDPPGRNQALGGVGCRPTRLWVMENLQKYFGYSYVTRTQPAHQDFVLDWTLPPTQLLYRSVFIGSKRPISNPNLLNEIPYRQSVAGELQSD